MQEERHGVQAGLFACCMTSTVQSKVAQTGPYMLLECLVRCNLTRKYDNFQGTMRLTGDVVHKDDVTSELLFLVLIDTIIDLARARERS